MSWWMQIWQVWPIRNLFYTHQDTMIELNNLWQLVMDELMRTRNEQVHKSEADRWGREGLKNLNKWMMIVVLVAAFFTGFRSVNRVVLLTGGTEDSVLSSRQKCCRLLHKLSGCQPCGAVGLWNRGFCAEQDSGVQELCESGGGRPGLPVPNSPYGLCGRTATFEEEGRASELRSCVKVAVDVLVSPSLIVRTVSVDVQQHLKKKGGPQNWGAAWKWRWTSWSPRP